MVESALTVTREVNQHIRDFAEGFPPDTDWEFFCECGCFTLVPLTLAEFDRGGAVHADGHPTPRARALLAHVRQKRRTGRPK